MTLTPWRVRPVGRRRTAAFAVLYVCTVLVGRATRLESGQLALVWPAAAVGFVWLVGPAPRPAAWRGDLPAQFGVGCLAQLLTGTSGQLSLSLSLTGTVQAVVAAVLFVRLVPDRRLGSLRALLALLVAAVTGASCGAALAVVAFASVPGVHLPALAGQWVLRNTVSTFVLAAVVLAGRLRGAARPAPAGLPEQVLALLSTAAAYGLVFGVSRGAPVAFLVLPLGVWVALRCSTSVTAGCNLVMALAVVVSTRLGAGPFGDLAGPSLTDRVLLAQTFIAVVVLVDLVLALYRDELATVTQGLQRARQDAVEQAELLATVFDSISDGVVVVAADGRPLLHNAAARELFAQDLDPAGRDTWSQLYGLSRVDGSELSSDDLPLARALRGHRDTGVDLVATVPAHPEGLVLSVTARPLPGGPGSHGAVAAFHDVTYVRRAAAEVEAARDLLSTVLSAATEQAIISTDPQGRITLFNTGAEQLLGHRAEDVLGQTPALFHDAAEIEARALELGTAPGFAVLVAEVAPGRPETRAWTYVTADGNRRDVVLSVTALQGPGAGVAGYLGIAVDVTEQRRAERALTVSELRFRQAFVTAPVGMFLADLPGDRPGPHLLQVNDAFCDLVGRSAATVLAAGISALVHPDDAGAVEAALAAVRSGPDGPARVELRFVRPDGSLVRGLVSASPVPTAEPDGPAQLIGMVEDVTARRRAEEDLTRQALHDPLTGLPNRTQLFDRLSESLATAERDGCSVGVLYLDLDGFKAVNDAAGHAAGDELLRQVARRLTATVRPGDTVARLGGDEFAVFCPDADDRRVLQAVAERVVQALRRPFVLDAAHHSVSVSVGLALSRPGSTPADLVRDADAAMYGAKRAGKDRLAVYEPGGARLPGQRSAREARDRDARGDRSD